ncbi:MAG TPA: paraquat-inducible protein A, partial [Acetobacteraceae bacterium]|nr:paraquat-inducible protein A [Acetobacteraceae bacterium]
RVHRRKPHALMRALALVMAGYVLLPVSNYFPMTILYRLGMVQQRLTIFRGIQLLFDNGHLPLAVLLSCTSLGIPIAKLMVMTWLFVSIGTRSDRALRWKTKTYRIVDEMGRWSNLDPFAVMIYAPMVQFGSLARVEVGLGSPSFLAVVVVSMLAARVFDPRLIWDFSKYPDRPLIRAVGELIEAPATGQADQDDQLEAKSA